MLEKAVKFQKAFDLLEAADRKYVNELGNKIPTEDDWSYANKLLPFLKIFYDTTLKLSASYYVTGNEYMKEIYGIGFLLLKMCQSEDPETSQMATKMKGKYDKYWGQIDNINVLIFVATVLDPRYKLSYVSLVIDKAYVVEVATALKSKINTVLYSMFDVYGAPLLQSKQVTHQVEDKTSMDVDHIVGAADFMNSMFDEEVDNLGITENKTELDIYLLEMKADRNDKSFSILNWWKSNASRYPVLGMMARDLLSMPVSTVASESAFSTGGRVLDPFRSSLTPKMVEALVCTQDWLRKNHESICIEECITELEKIESGIQGDEEQQHNLITEIDD
ncbi:hypothetical protein M569_09369 [Genlisea aurea]|uniref:HAT C-terminal dimerisation domain-containing protein n=1 Tax=Genlisea aurea TaxID=192259 RepID=S8DQT6_9LAMI|nr:hypothetical protein M569_09369 [Genlisea aurea]